MDAEITASPLEVRYPFVDLRLLRYMLAVPAIPWCRAKYLERRAMKGMLPDSVLRRPKAPLTSNPIWEARRGVGSRHLHAVPRLADYVDINRMPKDVGCSMASFYVDFRPLTVSSWLQNLPPGPFDQKKGVLDDEFDTKTTR